MNTNLYMMDETRTENTDYIPNKYVTLDSGTGDFISEVKAKIVYNIYHNVTATSLEGYASNWDTNATTTCSSLDLNLYSSWDSYKDDYGWAPPVITPSDRMRQMIRDRMAPAIHRGRKRNSMSIAMDIREERARQTVRRIIGEQAYKKFIRDGFITVVPKSGLTYRIFPGHGMTEVYDRGIMVDKLCVVLQGNFPPTDSLLMRYLLILNDEGGFSKYAVKHYVSQSTKLVFPTVTDVKPLTDAWEKLKVA